MAARTGRPRWALAVVGSAQFVLLLDLTIVNVALPTIQAELGIGHGHVQWLVSAYALTFGGFLLLAGRAADVFGRLRMFVAGILLFGVASLVAGLAVDELMLVAARAAQGLGGAAVSPAALALVATTFPEGGERNRALGAFAAVASAGGVSGLILGGVITEWAGWRWVFLVNVPIAVAAAVAAPLTLRDARNPVSRPLDLAGATFSSLALVALASGLAQGSQAGFHDLMSLAALTAAVLLGGAFVLVEQRAVDPLVPIHLLRLPMLLGTAVASSAVSTLIAATPFFLTLYMQRVLDLSPLTTGLAFLPMTLTVMGTSTVAARLAERVGIQRLLLFGIGTLVVAALALRRMSVDGSYVTDVLPGMLVFAVGLAVSYTAAAIGGTAGVPDTDQGVAGGLLNTFKQVGGAVGLAVLSLAGRSRDGQPTDGALVEGLQNAFMVALGFAALAAVAVVILVRTENGGRDLSAPRWKVGAARAASDDRRRERDGELVGAEC